MNIDATARPRLGPGTFLTDTAVKTRDILQHLASSHHACMQLVQHMPDPDGTLAAIIGIVARAHGFSADAEKPEQVAEVALSLIRSVIAPYVSAAPSPPDESDVRAATS